MALSDFSVEVVATGDELLDGSISDTHTRRLAEVLAPFGAQIRACHVTRDQDEAIAKALVEAGLRSRVVIVTGGLGPTEDDRSLEVAARSFGSQLVHDARAERNVRARLKRQGRTQLNPGHHKMMRIPQGARALSNPEGAAPAVVWEVGDRTYFFVPGVPSEFEFVLEKHLKPWFKKTFRPSSEAQYRFTFKVFGRRESELNELVKKLMLPSGVLVGFRTSLPENHIKFLVKARSRAAAQKRIRGLESRLRKALGSDLFATDERSFEESILLEAKRRKLKLCFAESCTAGSVSALLGRVSGASNVLERSFVVYSNQSKVELLGVRPESLKKFGAVSEEVAVEMARGALERSRAKVAVSITGVAGPTGGTKTKPVGLIWLARAERGQKRVVTRKLQLSFSRELNQRMSAYTALRFALGDWR